MQENFVVDRVLKELFQNDHPSLPVQLAGGVSVREFLNVEFTMVPPPHGADGA